MSYFVEVCIWRAACWIMLTASSQSNGCSFLAGSSCFHIAVFFSCCCIFLIPAETQTVTAAVIKGVRRNKHWHPDTPVTAGLLVEKKDSDCLLLCGIYRDGKHGGRENCNPLGEWMKASRDIDIEGERGVGVKIHFGKKSQDWPGTALNSANWSISLKACANKPKGPWSLFSSLHIQVLSHKMEAMKRCLLGWAWGWAHVSPFIQVDK